MATKKGRCLKRARTGRCIKRAKHKRRGYRKHRSSAKRRRGYRLHRGMARRGSKCRARRRVWSKRLHKRVLRCVRYGRR